MTVNRFSEVRGTLLCTSSTRPSNPAPGDRIYETDTGKELQYQGPNNLWTLPWGVAWGAVGTKASTAANGTATAGAAVEILDAVLGNYTMTAVVNRRYRIYYQGLLVNGSVLSDIANFNVRDGGASPPTTASTLLYTAVAPVLAVGSAGRITIPIQFTITGLTAGTHTIGVGTVRTNGTGVITPIGTRELYAEDIGSSGVPT